MGGTKRGGAPARPCTCHDVVQGAVYTAWTVAPTAFPPRLYVTRAKPTMFDFEEYGVMSDGLGQRARRTVGEARDPEPGERHDLVGVRRLRGGLLLGMMPTAALGPEELMAPCYLEREGS